MRIGLIADTHIPEAAKELPQAVFHAFKGVDLILHGGDMHVIDVMDRLGEVAPVLGVRGNGDVPLGRHRPGMPEDSRVKKVQLLEAGGLSIGLIHGLPLPHEVPWTNWDELAERLLGRRVDIIVCGDTHVANLVEHHGTLIINPGSPTLPNNQVGQLGTVALIEVLDARVRSKFIQL